ncbi:MAG: hypothetical protein ABH814_00400 [bacterium]
MLVELLISSLIIASVLFGSSQVLSTVAEKGDLALRRQEAQILAHNEMEKVLVIQENAWPWLWAGFCSQPNPCKTSYSWGMWWISSGSQDFGDYHIDVWVDNVGLLGLQKKIVTVKVSWDLYGGGEVIEKMIITRPQVI